jgi:hypothetical protein
LSIRKIDEKRVEVFEKAFRDEGWRGVVREWIKETDEILGDFDRALYHAQLGNKNEAFNHLQKVLQRRAIWATYLRVDPRLDPLRDDPRFSELVRRVDESP